MKPLIVRNLHAASVRHFALGVLASVLLAGCTFGGVPGQVDGWSIGKEIGCAAGDRQCQKMIDVARSRLDERDPGHAAIVSVTVHEEGMYPNDDGEMGLLFRSGGFPTIIVFLLADGSRRAIGTKYVLTDTMPTAYDRGPERQAGSGGDNAPVETP